MIKFIPSTFTAICRQCMGINVLMYASFCHKGESGRSVYQECTEEIFSIGTGGDYVRKWLCSDTQRLEVHLFFWFHLNISLPHFSFSWRQNFSVHLHMSAMDWLSLHPASQNKFQNRILPIKNSVFFILNSSHYYPTFLLKKHIMFALTSSLTRNLFLQIYSYFDILLISKGSETPGNWLLNYSDNLYRPFSLYSFPQQKPSVHCIPHNNTWSLSRYLDCYYVSRMCVTDWDYDVHGKTTGSESHTAEKHTWWGGKYFHVRCGFRFSTLVRVWPHMFGGAGGGMYTFR
jgi:hypothetical protein